MKKKFKEVKDVKLPMKFNVGLQKYEPELPQPKTKGKRVESKDSWQWLWVVLIAIALLVGIWLLSRTDLV